MSEENGLSPEEQAMEAALSQLRPVGLRFDAANVRLEARLRRMSRQVWMWRAAAVLAVVAGIAGVLVQRRGGERTAETRERPDARVNLVRDMPMATVHEVPVVPVSKDNYLALRDRVLTVGLSALDEGAAKRGPERAEPRRAEPTWNPLKQEQL